MSYKIYANQTNGFKYIVREDGVQLPLDLNNRDTSRFLRDWQAGVDVLDPEGNPLLYSEEAATTLGLVGVSND